MCVCVWTDSQSTLTDRKHRDDECFCLFGNSGKGHLRISCYSSMALLVLAHASSDCQASFILDTVSSTWGCARQKWSHHVYRIKREGSASRHGAWPFASEKLHFFTLWFFLLLFWGVFVCFDPLRQTVSREMNNWLQYFTYWRLLLSLIWQLPNNNLKEHYSTEHAGRCAQRSQGKNWVTQRINIECLKKRGYFSAMYWSSHSAVGEKCQASDLKVIWVWVPGLKLVWSSDRSCFPPGGFPFRDGAMFAKILAWLYQAPLTSSTPAGLHSTLFQILTCWSWLGEWLDCGNKQCNARV